MANENELDDIDRRLLNLLQTNLPLVAEPFATIARGLGLSEDEALERTRRLKAASVIRQISAIFDTRRLGYQSVLVAMSIAAKDLERGASVVSAHPGVSHNYERPHEFNLWFTLALPPDQALEDVVQRLAAESGAAKYHILPALRTFKIGVAFDMVDESVGTEAPAAAQGVQTPAAQQPPVVLSSAQRAAIRELQEDVPVTSRPFAKMARRLGIDEEQLLAQARDFVQQGVMRRFAAVLRHRRAGFSANAMSCWAVPEEQAEEAGKAMASFRPVTHCYQRPAFPDWPYSLFAMIHGRSRDDCQQVVDAIAERTGIKEHVVLYSTREFKKERVRYFAEG